MTRCLFQFSARYIGLVTVAAMLASANSPDSATLVNTNTLANSHKHWLRAMLS